MATDKHTTTDPKHSKDKEPAPTTQLPAAQPSPSGAETPEPAKSAREEADKAAKEGKPDPLAQIKISAEAGARGGTTSLSSELGKLPPIAALDGIRANAQSGYYATVPAKELVEALKGLDFGDNAAATAERDALVARAESGAFSGGR